MPAKQPVSAPRRRRPSSFDRLFALAERNLSLPETPEGRSRCLTIRIGGMSVHVGINSLVQDAVFALYRDFPDPVRHRGEE
jgi:hypothetical protein